MGQGGTEPADDYTVTSWLIEDDSQVCLMSDLSEGLTVILTIIWWFQNLGRGY
jgi:hypothetical protein